MGTNDLAAPLCSDSLGGQPTGLRVVLPDAGQKEESTDPDLLPLAAIVYGEASSQNVYEEMAAIANVIVRQRDARETTMTTLLGPQSTYAFAASDGNMRTAAFREAPDPERQASAGMASAQRAAQNALDHGQDYSNGAYFWDGADLKTNYANHPKVKLGIKFSKPEHNIYKVDESSVAVTVRWKVKDKDGKLTDGTVRGQYTYVYESTAAYGGTVFWKYGADFLKATGNKEFN